MFDRLICDEAQRIKGPCHTICSFGETLWSRGLWTVTRCLLQGRHANIEVNAAGAVRLVEVYVVKAVAVKVVATQLSSSLSTTTGSLLDAPRIDENEDQWPMSGNSSHGDLPKLACRSYPSRSYNEGAS